MKLLMKSVLMLGVALTVVSGQGTRQLKIQTLFQGNSISTYLNGVTISGTNPNPNIHTTYTVNRSPGEYVLAISATSVSSLAVTAAIDGVYVQEIHPSNGKWKLTSNTQTDISWTSSGFSDSNWSSSWQQCGVSSLSQPYAGSMIFAPR